MGNRKSFGFPLGLFGKPGGLVLTALVTLMVLVPQAFGFVYTNYYIGPNISVAAISNFPNKVFLTSSRVYEGNQKKDGNAGQGIDNDYPIYFKDIAPKITDRHRALGFIDVMVSLDIDPLTVPWRMFGSTDRRDDQDIRAVDGSSTIWPLSDTNYRVIYRAGPANASLNYNSSNVWLTTTNPTFAGHTYLAKSGEYCVARFAVPRSPVSVYGLFLGKQIIRTGTIGAEGTGTRTWSIQVNLYTPALVNVLIPRIDLTWPPMDGAWLSVVDDSSAFRFSPVRRIQIPANVAVTFSASNSYNATGLAVTNWQWDLQGNGTWVPGAETVTTTYGAKGLYTVYVRLAASNVAATNNGDLCDSTNNFFAQRPDTSPASLPFFLEVVDPPGIRTLSLPRPSPFVIGLQPEVQFDLALDASVNCTAIMHRLDGTPVKTIFSGTVPQGLWTVRWDGKDTNGATVGEGIYFLRVVAGDRSLVRKCHVVRLL